MNLTTENIKYFPFILQEQVPLQKINALVVENIRISKQEWDAYELSWDFMRHPLLTFQTRTKTVEASYF